MEFLTKMKSRERIEMALKTISMVIVGLILIILMEGMIFGIYMNKINDNTTGTYTNSACVAYCEEMSEGKYKVYLHNTESGAWMVIASEKTEAEIDSKGYKNIVWNAPTPFDVSINYIHYIVMGVFIAGILGFYGWRFFKLDRDYKKFEKKYNKTGKIFA
ncbi:MAG: hypothetical protein J6Q15_03100 [Clostridia bacterium]|nr:hypothetical protein [Clostridia bacterium]